MISYHFHIHPQFIYESFHIHYIKSYTIGVVNHVTNRGGTFLYFKNVDISKTSLGPKIQLTWTYNDQVMTLHAICRSKGLKALPATDAWGYEPVLISINDPVPMVQFTSPVSKQHCPNTAACWSATLNGWTKGKENQKLKVNTVTNWIYERHIQYVDCRQMK